MTTTDWIGFLGVTILLIAYFLNLKNILQKDDFTYLLLNVLGASIACAASILLNYWPFIILEACWTLVSITGLLQYFTKNSKAKST